MQRFRRLGQIRRAILSGTIAIAIAGCASVPDAHVIPSSFENDRVFVVAENAGPPLRFYADTGGGWNMISNAAAERLQLQPIGTVPGEAPDITMPIVGFPDTLTKNGIPRPQVEPMLDGNLVVVPSLPVGGDGFFGSRWFAGHVWTIDYRAQTLRVGATAHVDDAAHRVPLGFRRNAQGLRDLDFPRLTIGIDGEALDFLLDTGATAMLSSSASVQFGLSSGTLVGTSFIAKSVFDRWTARHPEWRVLAEADARSKSAMIEVPRVEIAGITVGPVWFTQRRDTDLHEFMSPMMDRRIDGALGGSALRYFRVTIDYPAAVAYFETPGR